MCTTFAHLKPNCGGSLTAGVAALLTTFKDFSSLDEKSDLKLTKNIQVLKKQIEMITWEQDWAQAEEEVHPQLRCRAKLVVLCQSCNAYHPLAAGQPL